MLALAIITALAFMWSLLAPAIYERHRCRLTRATAPLL
jgi:hypothetical protein